MRALYLTILVLVASLPVRATEEACKEGIENFVGAPVKKSDVAWVGRAFKKFEQALEPSGEASEQAFKEISLTGHNPEVFLKGASEEVLRRLAVDLEYAVAVTKKINEVRSGAQVRRFTNQTKLQLEARALLARFKFPGLRPGQVLTESELREQAGLLGLDVQSLNRAFRFDSRDPATIAGAGGFTPNPNKRAMTLVENSAPTADGGANFVSVTAGARNNHFITQDYFHKEPVTPEVHAAVAQEVLAKLSPKKGPYTVQAVSRTYEYEVRDILAVDTAKFGAKEESEWVTNQVPKQNIKRYREVLVVRIRTPKQVLYRSLFRPWEKMVP